MANIGSFKKSGQEFQARSHPELQTKVSASSRGRPTNDNAPSHRSTSVAPRSGRLVEALQRGRDYLSVKLDDPSFNAPIYANLFDDEDAETYTLICPAAQAQRRLSRPSATAPAHRAGALLSLL